MRGFCVANDMYLTEYIIRKLMRSLFRSVEHYRHHPHNECIWDFQG